MSKVINLIEFKRNKLNQTIKESKEENYLKYRYEYLLDIAECMEEHDLETAQKICKRLNFELTLKINPVMYPGAYSVELDTAPDRFLEDPTEITYFMVNKNTIPLCMEALAKELRMYYTYLIDEE